MILRPFFLSTVLGSCLAVSGWAGEPPAGKPSEPGSGVSCGVDFSALPSPILFRGDERWAYRDPAAVYHDGRFYLFFTVSELDGELQRKTVPGTHGCASLAIAWTRDFRAWDWPRNSATANRSQN